MEPTELPAATGTLADLAFLAQPPAFLPAPLAAFSLIAAFVFAACWGSFTNVVIARVPAGISVVTPRSRCPKCNTQIAGFDNIPILSWIILRAKCRSCKAPISARYPFIEFLIGVAGTACVARFGWSVPALEMFVFVVILIAIAFIDIDTWTVPHPMWIALAVAGLGFAALSPIWLDRVIGAVAAGVFMSALVVAATAILRRTGRLKPDEFAMGWGDPLILVGVGAFLGWQMLPLVLFFASLQGTVIAIALKMRGGLKGDQPVSETDDWVPPKDAVPFGPFLALGALEAAFFGDAVLGLLYPTY